MMAGSALRFDTPHNSQLATHNSQLTTHNSQLTTHVPRLPAASFHDGGICAALRHASQLTTHNSQLTTHNSQLTTHNSQLTTHNSQLTTHVPHLPAASFHDGGICAALRHASQLTTHTFPHHFMMARSALRFDRSHVPPLLTPFRDSLLSNENC